MILKQRIDAFTKVGLFIRNTPEQLSSEELQLRQGLQKVIELAYINNGWFSPNFVNESIQNIGMMLNRRDIEMLCEGKETSSPKTVAVICAGNIPIVAFHDLLCVLLSGHKVLIKLSSDDNVLLPFFLKLLTFYEPEFENFISFADGKLTNFNAVIATGSGNTTSHFKYYFGKYPNIIRGSRTSIAILDGTETNEQLKLLGKDVFLYYGLGCRNVSKLMVPEEYDFSRFFESIIDFGYVIENKKYGNNYDYHRALYLLEKEDFLDNNFLMVKKSEHLHSPVATLYYQYYKTLSEVKEYIKSYENEIQCIVGKDHIPFGYSQSPVITDFADNVNTWEFLLTL